VQQTTDGGYIVIGSTQSFGAGNFDLWLSKWTASGDLSWARTLGGTGYDIGHSVQQTTDGGYIVIGSTDSFGAGRADLWLSKWTASGEVSWTRTLGGIEYDEGDSVQQTTDGGYIVAGDTYSFGAGSVDLWLSKWNSLGETASNQCVSSPNVTSVATVVSAQTPNVTLGTPSVSAQDLVVSAQVANPAVSTTCNEPPVLSTSSNNFTYMEKDPATVIGYNLTVSDADNPTLVHAQVSISSGFVSIEDVLGFSDQNGIVGNYQAETGVLTLTGASSVANYETALRSVTYLNPSNNPSTGIRTFEFIANDGQLDSNTVAVRATVVAINDAPSTSESPNLTVLLAAIAAGTGSLLLCLGAVSYCVWRKRQRGPVNALARELEMVYPEPTPSLDRGVELVSPDRLEKGYTIISDRFALINKITPEKAQLLQQQTGIEVTFTEGKHKQKFALGQGQFGKLRLAQDMETREFVGVKKIKGEAQIAASEEEAGLLAHVSGLAHVIQLKASVRTLGSDRQAVQYQFLELAGFGSGETLQRCLAQLQDPALKRKLLVHIARGLLTGFSQLHEQKATVHLDMKPANFVLTQAGEVKVIDFGCARLLPEGTALMRGGNGDMGYFSPDRIAHCRFLVGQHPGETLSHFDGKQADSWALGVTLFELATNRKLFPLIGATQIMASRDTAYVIEQLALVSELYRPAADSFWAVVKGLLDPHPKTRLTPQTALAHPIFQDPAYRFTAAAQEAVFRKLKALDCLYGSDQAPVQASPALPKDQVYAAPYLAQQGGGSASVRFPSGRSSVSSRPSFFQPVSGQRRIDVYANRPEARDEYANRPEVRDEYANAWR
jgi:serine/threonine protein kinase